MTDELPLPEPVACQWLQHGKVVNAFNHPPGDRSRWDYDGFWSKKGYDKAPLFTAGQMRERDAMWAERIATAVSRERDECLAEIETGIWIDKTTEEVLDSIAAAIRAR